MGPSVRGCAEGSFQDSRTVCHFVSQVYRSIVIRANRPAPDVASSPRASAKRSKACVNEQRFLLEGDAHLGVGDSSIIGPL